MRILAILLNIVLLGTAVALLIDEGVPRRALDWYLCAIIFFTPLCTLLALLLTGGESWIGLYFRRKALEERKKIDQLQGR